MNNFVKYQSYQNKIDFEEIIGILNEHKIDYETEDYPINFIADPKNTSFSHEFVIKLKKESFNKVNDIQELLSQRLIENIDPEHYLFEYNNDELIKVIKEQDEWSKLDVALAKNILKKRGLDVSLDKIEELKTERIRELSVPEKKQTFLVALGYISSFFGGLVGILIGWHLINHKRTLPNGEKIFDYSDNDRKHGKIIMYLGIFILGVGTLLRIIEII